MSTDKLRKTLADFSDEAPCENMLTTDRSHEERASNMVFSPKIGCNEEEKISKTGSVKDLKFSIENILSLNYPLSKVGTKHHESEHSAETDINDETAEDGLSEPASDSSELPWLQYTRYKPPKLNRIKKREGLKKRKLGRNPRIPFTQHQVATLEQKFRRTHYLSSMDVAELSSSLNLTENRVKIWFQNRRARERRDRESALRIPQLINKPELQHMSHVTSPWSNRIPTDSLVLSHIQQAFHFDKSAFNPIPCLSLSGECFKN